MKTEISTENRKKKQQKNNNNNNKKNDLGCVRSQLLKVNGLRQNFSLGVWNVNSNDNYISYFKSQEGWVC